MQNKDRQEIENFVKTQKAQLGLDDNEARNLFEQSVGEELDDDADAFAAPAGASAKVPMHKKGQKRLTPYLSESATIHARPSKVSKFHSLLFEYALPNEYIVQIGGKEVQPVLGGKFFKPGKRFLKFPATVQTVYFTSDNANKNYQGLRIDGYACWRIDPERPETAARNLDFSDQSSPMGNTNRILRTICTEAIRHIIANLSVEEALTKKDEIGLNLKSQLERIERTWGIVFDQVGIERVTILSSSVFNDLQQKTRDSLRLAAAESRMETDQSIQKKEADYTEEMAAIRYKTEKESRIMKAETESEIHEVELRKKSEQEQAEREAEEARRKAEHEAAERAAEAAAEREKRQTVRDAETEILKEQEAYKLKMAKAEADAEAAIKTAETEADIAEASARSLLAAAEAGHEKELRQQELYAELTAAALNTEIRQNEMRLSSEIKAAAARSDQALKEKRAELALNHEAETKRLVQVETEEEILNRISENRVFADFVSQLPEIALAQKADQSAVFSGGDNTPLTRNIAEILSLFDMYRKRRDASPDVSPEHEPPSEKAESDEG